MIEDEPPQPEPDARDRLSAMSNSQIADMLVEVWAETPLHTLTSWVLEEAVHRLKGKS